MKCFFTQCTVRLWNSLPQDLIETKRIAELQWDQTFYMDSKSTLNYYHKYQKKKNQHDVQMRHKPVSDL